MDRAGKTFFEPSCQSSILPPAVCPRAKSLQCRATALDYEHFGQRRPLCHSVSAVFCSEKMLTEDLSDVWSVLF